MACHGQTEEFTLEYPCHSPTELRWFRARVTRFRDGSGNIVIAHELITGQKLAENKLKMSELKFRAIFDNAPLGIAIVEVNTGSMEKRYFKKDNSTIWTNLTVAGLKIDLETVEHFVGIVSDITEIRNNSEKLMQWARSQTGDISFEPMITSIDAIFY